MSENFKLSFWRSWRKNGLSQISYIYVPKVNIYVHTMFEKKTMNSLVKRQPTYVLKKQT